MFERFIQQRCDEHQPEIRPEEPVDRFVDQEYLDQCLPGKGVEHKGVDQEDGCIVEDAKKIVGQEGFPGQVDRKVPRNEDEYIDPDDTEAIEDHVQIAGNRLRDILAADEIRPAPQAVRQDEMPDHDHQHRDDPGQFHIGESLFDRLFIVHLPFSSFVKISFMFLYGPIKVTKSPF